MNKKPQKEQKLSFKEHLKNIPMIFFVFFKLGALTFGGGYAMLALIEHEIVEKRHWLSKNEMLDIIAISESTPGAIAINLSTYIGIRLGGIIGAIVASFSVILAPFFIIIGISHFLEKFSNNIYVGYFFIGVRASVCALILNAVIKLSVFLNSEKRPVVFITMFIALILSLLNVFKILNFDNIFLILAAICFGLIVGVCEEQVRKFKRTKNKKYFLKNSKSFDEEAL